MRPASISRSPSSGLKTSSAGTPEERHRGARSPFPIAINEWTFFGGNRDSCKRVPASAFREMFRHSELFQMDALTFATALMSENRTAAILNPTRLLFKMDRDRFGTIPVEVTGDSPQPKPAFPPGGDQPAINPPAIPIRSK